MSIATPDGTGRLERLADQLAAMLAEIRAADPGVDPRAVPGNVAPGELIESAWGNAVVDTLNVLLGRRRIVNYGTASLPSTATAVGANRLVNAVSIPAVTFPSWVQVNAATALGSTAGQVVGKAKIKALNTGGFSPLVGPIVAGGASNQFGMVSIAYGWDVTAGGIPGFELYVDIDAAGGTPYAQSTLTWVQYAAGTPA